MFLICPQGTCTLALPAPSFYPSPLYMSPLLRVVVCALLTRCCCLAGPTCPTAAQAAAAPNLQVTISSRREGSRGSASRLQGAQQTRLPDTVCVCAYS